MKRVAIIPARSGSKGLRDKNIRKLCGKPLMAYSIEAAVKSQLFEQVIVSSDSPEYLEIAAKYGAMPMLRNDNLASDRASTYMVIRDVLGRLKIGVDYFVLLQPTSPLRDERHIAEAVELFESGMDKYDFLVSMKKAELSGVLVRPIDEDGSLKYFDTDFANYSRQQYEEYSPNGAIYIGKAEEYLSHGHFYGNRSMAYIMEKMESVDIDDEIDFELARVCMEKM